jgi:phosphoribosylanthranilate isomerase
MTNRTLVKICGITRTEDALLAAELGAAYVGFIFAPSRRRISPEDASAIISKLPPSVTPVGVFVNAERNGIMDVTWRSGIRAVQLHGEESPEFCAGFPGIEVLKAFRVHADFDAGLLETYGCDGFVLDAWHPERRGGTGETFDWSLAVAAADAHRVLLAGGLMPENVGEAINHVKPYGVDLSSGIESAPGIKDHVKMRALFAAIGE